MPSSIEPTTVPITSSHIPVYQPFNHAINTNSNLNNGFSAEPSSHHSNPFQCLPINNETTKSDSLHQPIETLNTTSPPITSPSFVQQQFSPSLSRTSSMSDRDRITDSPLPMMPNFVRSPTQRTSEHFSPLAKTNSILASKSPPPMEPNMTIPRHDEFTPRISNLNYGYAQEPTIATLEHQRIDHRRTNASPQMIHFQQIEDRMVDQLNELYKATLMMNQRDTTQRQEHDDVDRSNQTYLQQQQQQHQQLQQQQQHHEPVYNPGKFQPWSK